LASTQELLAPSADESKTVGARSSGDDLLLPSDASSGDPLGNMGPDQTQEAQRQKRSQDENAKDPSSLNPHAEAFADTLYPSATKCAKCHQHIYDEWRVSSHAYAAVSPMFQRFEQAMQSITRGTIGTFCMRCHAPIATQLQYPREASIFDGPQVFREGITCVACHRVVERYGRVNGERRVEAGSVFDPVIGLQGGEGIARVIAQQDHFKVKIDPNDKRPHQEMHRDAIRFEQLSDSSYCAGCHQVVVQPGVGLEIVWAQYMAGPSCKKGVSCQDCHMGQVPGVPSGYATLPAAEINGKALEPARKHANHMFYGPGYSIAHPGIFPHNEKSLRWSAQQWLNFDWRSGWGTEAFEKSLGSAPAGFPEPWTKTDERRDARKIIDQNLELIRRKRETSVAVLENGSRIDGPYFHQTPRCREDVQVSYTVSNISEGHNMPSGSLGAQPQLWLNVVLIGPGGDRLWESGYLDGNGDLADLHSLQVRQRLIARDDQLFNLQTKFLITNVKGTDREFYLPLNIDIDPLPYIRPGNVPYTVLNHAPFSRMEAHSIGPVDSRQARYRIPGQLLSQQGVYRLTVRMRSRVEPVYFVRFVGGTSEMEHAMNENIIDVHPSSTEFLVR
jgi:nitrate/TMAO reductase-like tetraheme cytochrome c subunit